MTAGERLIQQGEARGLEQGIRRGLEQGLEQGIRRGLEQGIQQGEKAILLRMLRNRFGNLVDETVERRVEAASAEEVAAWADRWMSATTLAELLAG